METENATEHEFDPQDYPAWAINMYEEGTITHEVLEDMKQYPNESSYHVETDLRLLEEDVANNVNKSSVSQDYELLMADIKDAQDRHEDIVIANMGPRLSAIKDYLETVH